MMWKICILVDVLLLLPSVCGQDVWRTAHFINYPYKLGKTWSAAQAYCREHHTDLVTIGSESENQNFVSGFGWIGLYQENSTSPWKWSRGDKKANFIIWDDDEPRSNKHCAFKNRDKEKWNTDPCDTIHSFMCFEERVFLVKVKRTWEKALRHCRTLKALDRSMPATIFSNHLYDLATLITPQDHDIAREIAQDAATDEVWTGLRYLAGQWVWVGGEQVQYQDIQSCPAQRTCGILEKNGTTQFGIRDCGERKYFLCYDKFLNQWCNVTECIKTAT